MTTPAVPDLSSIIPSKAKTWAALVGSLLSFVVPFVLESVNALPAPWPALIGVVLFILTTLGVYHGPYAPTGTVLAVDPNSDKPANQPDTAPTAVVIHPGNTIKVVPKYDGPLTGEGPSDVPNRPTQNPWK